MVKVNSWRILAIMHVDIIRIELDHKSFPTWCLRIVSSHAASRGYFLILCPLRFPRDRPERSSAPGLHPRKGSRCFFQSIPLLRRQFHAVLIQDLKMHSVRMNQLHPPSGFAPHSKAQCLQDFLVRQFRWVNRTIMHLESISKIYKRTKKIYTAFVEQWNKVDPIVTKVTSHFYETDLENRNWSDVTVPAIE